MGEKKPLEMAWVSPQFGWGRVSDNYQVGAYSVGQVDGDSDRYGTHLPALWGEGSAKEQWPLPVLLSRREMFLQPSY